MKFSSTNSLSEHESAFNVMIFFFLHMVRVNYIELRVNICVNYKTRLEFWGYRFSPRYFITTGCFVP